MSERTFISATMICFDDIPGANFSSTRTNYVDLKHYDGKTMTKKNGFQLYMYNDDCTTRIKGLYGE